VKKAQIPKVLKSFEVFTHFQVRQKKLGSKRLMSRQPFLKPFKNLTKTNGGIETMSLWKKVNLEKAQK